MLFQFVYIVRIGVVNLANIVSAIEINGAAPKAGEGRLLFDLLIKIVIIQYFLIIKIGTMVYVTNIFTLGASGTVRNEMNLSLRKGKIIVAVKTRFPSTLPRTEEQQAIREQF